VCPLPPVSGGRGTLVGEKGVGRVPIPTRGIHCDTLYMYVLCGYMYSLDSEMIKRKIIAKMKITPKINYRIRTFRQHKIY
jgi:hypothetical protein